MRGYDYLRPQNLDEVFTLKEEHLDARFIAGGTDLLAQIRSRQIEPQALISLRSVEELTRIKSANETEIGAGCPIADLIEHAALKEKYPILVQAAKRLGSPQIRSVATVGGNLANGSPCADTAQALLVLEARVVLASRNQTREVPLVDFFIGPKQTALEKNEIIRDIILGPSSGKAQYAFIKKGRVRMDIALASLALLVELDGRQCTKARIAAGSVAPVPLRLTEVERILEGREMSSDLIERARDVAEQSIAPISDVRATADYRRRLIGVSLKRVLNDMVGQVTG